MNFQQLLVLPCVSVSAARTTGKTERLPLPKVCGDEQARDQLNRAATQTSGAWRQPQRVITSEMSRPISMVVGLGWGGAELEIQTGF